MLLSVVPCSETCGTPSSNQPKNITSLSSFLQGPYAVFFKQVCYSRYCRKLPNVGAYVVHSVGLAFVSGRREDDSVVIVLLQTQS
jgi:hypothetical protein